MSIINAIKESWAWIGINADEVVDENDFGNLMIRDNLGRYWRLCPEEVYCKIVAKKQSDLDTLLINQEFLSDWYMAELTAYAREKYGLLPPGHKFHLAMPGILGGKYDLSNIRTVPQIEQIRFSGDIGRQIHELPDGVLPPTEN